MGYQSIPLNEDILKCILIHPDKDESDAMNLNNEHELRLYRDLQKSVILLVLVNSYLVLQEFNLRIEWL